VTVSAFALGSRGLIDARTYRRTLATRHGQADYLSVTQRIIDSRSVKRLDDRLCAQIFSAMLNLRAALSVSPVRGFVRSARQNRDRLMYSVTATPCRVLMLHPSPPPHSRAPRVGPGAILVGLTVLGAAIAREDWRVT
jgi:hypothetical protein